MRRAWRGAAAAAGAVIVLGACAGGPGAERPAPRAAAADDGAAPARQPAGFFTFVEETEGGGEIALRSAARLPVDVNSAVRIEPVPGAFAVVQPGLHGAAASLGSVGPLTDSLRLARDLLRQLTDSLGAVSGRIAAAAAALERNPADAAAEARLRGSLAAHASILLPVMDFLERRGADLEPVLAEPDAQYAALGALLRQHVESLDARLNGALESFEAARAEAGPRVQVWAVHYGRGRDAAQVHLAGYDNLPAGDPRPVDKLSLVPTEAEQQRIETAHQLSREVLALAAQSRALASRFEEDARGMLTAVREAVREFAALLDSLPAPAELDALAGSLGGGAAPPALAAALDEVKRVLAPVETLRGAHQRVLQSFVASGSPLAPLALLDTLRQQIAGLQEGLPERLAALRSQLPAALDSLRASALASLAAAGGAERSGLESLVEGALPGWRAAAARIDAIAQPYLAAVGTIGQIRQILDFARLADTVGGSQVSPERIQAHLVTLRADQVIPTTLDLMRIGRQEGDRVVLNVRVVDGASGATLAQAEHTFLVRTYGFHRRFTGGLGFADEAGRDGLRPGVATSWVLHYRARPGQDRPWYEDLARPLDPRFLGIALTSMVFTSDDELQLGFGAMLTLFGDLVQVGRGYNLHTERAYWLLSTPLLDLLERVRGGGADGSR